jgi:hypothetical protein
VGISVHRIINSRSDLFLRAKSSTFRIAFPEAGEFTPRQSTQCAKENSSNVWRLRCNRLLSLTTFDGISGLVRIAHVSEPHDINDRCNSPTSLEKTLLPRRAAWNVFAHESESQSLGIARNSSQVTQRYGNYVAGGIDVVLLVYETDPLTCPKCARGVPWQ